MIFTIFKRRFSTVVLQPAFIFCVIIEAAAAIFFIFEVKFQNYDGTIVLITIFGAHIDEVSFFANRILPTFIGAIIMSIVFFSILIASTIYPELVGDPLFGIIVTKPLTRRELLISEVSGAGAAMCANVFVFLILIFLVFSIKAGTWPIIEFLGAILAFCILIFVVLALALLFGSVGEKATSSEILIIIIYFVLSPMIDSAGTNKGALLNIVSLIIPSTNHLSNAIQSSLMGAAIVPEVFIQPVIISLLCVVISMIVFERKDF